MPARGSPSGPGGKGRRCPVPAAPLSLRSSRELPRLRGSHPGGPQLTGEYPQGEGDTLEQTRPGAAAVAGEAGAAHLPAEPGAGPARRSTRPWARRP